MRPSLPLVLHFSFLSSHLRSGFAASLPEKLQIFQEENKAVYNEEARPVSEFIDRVPTWFSLILTGLRPAEISVAMEGERERERERLPVDNCCHTGPACPVSTAPVWGLRLHWWLHQVWRGYRSQSSPPAAPSWVHSVFPLGWNIWLSGEFSRHPAPTFSPSPRWENWISDDLQVFSIILIGL